MQRYICTPLPSLIWHYGVHRNSSADLYIQRYLEKVLLLFTPKRLLPHGISAPLCILICIILLSTYSTLTCVPLKNICISNCSRSLHTRTTYLLLICAWTRLVCFDVFFTVHHSIDLFQLPTLMYNSLFINNMYVTL